LVVLLVDGRSLVLGGKKGGNLGLDLCLLDKEELQSLAIV
jgi:hypothetical protein